MKSGYRKKTKATDHAADQTDLLEQIQKRAFELWEAGGRRSGNDLEHWFQAQRELLSQANDSGKSSPERGMRKSAAGTIQPQSIRSHVEL